LNVPGETLLRPDVLSVPANVLTAFCAQALAPINRAPAATTRRDQRDRARMGISILTRVLFII
jgi:hypothetical protein